MIEFDPNKFKKAMKEYVQDNQNLSKEDFAYFLHIRGVNEMYREQSIAWFDFVKGKDLVKRLQGQKIRNVLRYYHG